MVKYDRLWHLLIDKGMKRMDLCDVAGLSRGTVTKLGKNGYVALKVLDDICTALDCRIEDVVEVVPGMQPGRVGHDET